MDGGLARYDRTAYDRNNGPAPGIALFEHEKSHYFRHCMPDPIAISMIKELLKDNSCEVYILTSIAPHIPWASADKQTWLSQNLPEFDTATHLIIADSDKAETILVLKKLKQLNSDMILIDDYNKNLEDWTNAGGTAVKYLNGINSPDTFDGPVINAFEQILV